MVIIFCWLTFFIYFICFLNILSLSELDSFYVKNLNDFGKFDGVKLDSDNKGLLFRATTYIQENQPFFLINKEWLISSCMNLLK